MLTRSVPALAFLTLVENAVRHGVDHSEQGGAIEVGASPESGGGLRLWVRDTGVGMDPRGHSGYGPEQPARTPGRAASRRLARARGRGPGAQRPRGGGAL